MGPAIIFTKAKAAKRPLNNNPSHARHQSIQHLLSITQIECAKSVEQNHSTGKIGFLHSKLAIVRTLTHRMFH